MDGNVDFISLFKKFPRGVSLEQNFRVATVDEAKQLFEAIQAQSQNVASSAPHELLPGTKNEVFSLKDGYLFDFGPISTFYPDIDNKFLWRHKLGVSQDFREVEGARLCLPLALLHACAEEDEKEIRDLVMVQSVHATFGRHVHHEQEQEHVVPSSSMRRGFAAVEGFDGRISRVLHVGANYYTGIWGCRSEASSHDAAAAASSGDASNLPQPSALKFVCWPPASGPLQTIGSQGARLALLNAYTAWPKSGGNALHFAARTRKSGVVALLLDLEMQVMRQMQLNTSASYTAAPPSDRSILISLAAAGLSGSLMLNTPDIDGNNALCCAAEAEEDNSKVVDLLLRRDQPTMEIGKPSSTLFQQNKLGMSALLIAASKGHVSTLCCLLRAFSSKWPIKTRILYEPALRQPFFELTGGNNFIHYCVARGDIHFFTEVLGLMPSNWHSITQLMLCFPDNLGVTALELALAKGYSEICELVLKKMNELMSGSAVDLEIVEAGIQFMMSQSERDCDGNNILHLYALGGGSKEVGKQLTEWVELLMSSLDSGHLFSSLPSSAKGLYIGLNKMEAMINQLNCAGETPCITALRRGHSDALQVLMPIWREDLATHYLNPRTRDTVLHCYAKSSFPPNFDHSFFIHHCTVNSSLLKQLLNTRNEDDHTPILSSLYSGQTMCAVWFLSQEDVQIEQRDHVLHVYASCCDDEALGKALQAKLGQVRVQAEMKESIHLKLHRRGRSQGRTTMKGTPLMLAVAGGNLQACAALLKVQDGGGGNYIDFNESMDDHQNNVLHMLCRNKSANIDIEECWKVIVTAKVTDTSDFAECLINARNNDGDTPLRLALKSGNIKACEWLLDTSSDLLVINPSLDGTAVFDCFQEGASMNLAVWKKLKAAYCKNDPNPLQHAKKVLSSSLLNAISTSFEDFMQCFIKDEDVMAIIYAKDTSFWSSYQDHLSGLRSLNILIEMHRYTHLAQCIFDKETLFLAAMKGNFELFELSLQAQSYEHIEEEFNQDKYQKLLKHVLYSPMSSNIMLLLIQKIQMENCNSLFISWQRFLDLMGGQYDAIGGWMWAHEFLAVQRMAPFARNNSNMLPPEGQDMEQNRLMDQDKHFMQAVSSFIQRQSISIEDDDDDDDDSGGDDDGNCENADTQRHLSILRMLCQRPGVLQGGLPLLQTLLVSIKNDNPQLVSLLLLIFSAAPFISADTSIFDATMLQVLVSYCRMSLLHNIHAVLHILFYRVYQTRFRLRAFLTKPVDPRLRGSPFFLHCTAEPCAMASFIKLLNFAQSCEADDMVDYKGQTALHLACALQRNEIFQTLVCMCPRLVNVPASRGRTPLMLAALHGSVQMVKSLLPLRKRGLSFERDADGRTPLHYAAQSPIHPPDTTIEVIQLLLSRARQDEDSALLLWAMAGQTSNAATADAFAVNSSIAEFLQARMKEEKMTRSELLQRGIHKGNLVMVRDLINRGADTSMLNRELFSKLGLYETKQVDQPTSKDSLGRASLSKGIASLFLNPLTSVPITVGVLGAWGMGKSSIMLQTEITLMMTIIARNLLSTKEDFPSVIQGKIINTEVEKLQHDVLAIVDNLTQPQLKHNKFLHGWPNAKKKHKDATKRRIEDFLSVYRPECMPLYKGLALMSRHKLFQCPSLENETSFSLEIPTCLTIYYNAWLYHGESDASSGLALTIIKELEGCMNTAQWLKLCWNYAYRLDPIFIFSNITLPLLVMVVIGGWIVWIIWKLLSIPSLANQEGLNSFKYGSIPVSTVIIAWIILRNIMNVLKPVSEQILKSLNTSQKYQEKLGYQQQIVNDIQFFKDQLGQETGFGWKVVGRIWSLIVENKDNIPKTNIKKAFVSIDKLRIVVFIDDLDRCSKPTYVIELLGATNLILSTCAINVVLGMNKDIIKEVISGEYKGDIEATEKFLEKVIHVPIDLYEPNEEETFNFLQEQLMFVNPKEKLKQPSTSFNQEIFNTRNQRNKKVKQVIPSRVPNNEPSQWDMDSKDVRPLQGHVTVDLQEGSSSMSNLVDKEKEDIIIETQVRNEAFKPSASNMKEGKMMYNTTTSKKAQRTSNAKQNEDRMWQKWSKNEDIRFVVEFPLLVANYNEAEVRVIKELQKRAKGEQKKPRNWKRLLSYHQLVRSIISHSKIDSLSYIYGWQEQLIIWLFVCYNWKEQMNEIFENWGKLVIVLRESPLPMLMQPSLHLIVDLQKQNYEKPTSSETPQGAPSSSNQRYLEDWRKLEETLYGAYDVDMQSVNIFQKYRFHCNIGHIHWEDGMDSSKTRDE